MWEELKKGMSLHGMDLSNFIGLSEGMKKEIFQWRNDDRVRSQMLDDRRIDLEEHLRFMEGLKDRHDCLYYLCNYDGGPVGVVSVSNISFRHKRATWGIYKQPNYRSANHGFMMADCVLILAFEYLHLNTLKSEILATNKAAIIFNQSLGFKQEGLLREYIIHPERIIDLVVMGMTAAEYFGLKQCSSPDPSTKRVTDSIQ